MALSTVSSIRHEVDLKNELPKVTETRHHINIVPRTVYRYIQDRRLLGFRLRKEWRVRRTDLEQWLRMGPGLVPHP